ncbi:class I poly(R)-hydroxyalkanoic acid synthase [Thioalkalivibrio sp. XN8]|uniref:PHA/PHB synthase family protein n=1 Tax=Thioalkalivibrio sp. XN8 TaxID=2712863 RepID=UPI0013EDEC37|nr:class I poly(R)-hydroxyalkanoic acid synthase [Thioalkalivibrio sp. XN8]NGP52638.1 class I poly(R)-hydroxyalkanoic acid synthase [Thioalkalivibrio sp. XN8]
MSVLKNFTPANLQTQYQMTRVMAGLSADVTRAYAQWMAALALHPGFVVKHSVSLTGDYLGIGGDLLRQAAGSPVKPNGHGGDRRFSGESWERRPVFNAARKAWQANTRTLLSLADGTPGLDADTARKLRFFTGQFLDALAPSNFALSNPEVLAAAKASKGRNFIDGLRNFWSDLDLEHGRLKISMSDMGAFKVGRDLAITPGKVIYQNELMQLIQYTPTTAKVARRPLLIIPPWLNKYYVLDMQPSNSLVRWAVEQGHTVFLISWVNPNGETRDKTFDDYLREGPLAALDVIKDVTGQKEVNAMGYCLGGILLTVLLAWLEKKGLKPIRSATFMTTLVDYTDVGDIKVFVNEELVDRLEAAGRAKGFIPGDNVSWGFRMLRAPDLIWSFIINHYLLGKPRVPFDLLYWNEDATNMPAACHTWFMRNMYLKNLLREPDALEVAGESIDVSRIQTPSYVLATRDDHIAPWKSCYQATQLFAGPSRFVLGNSGHIAGAINPPTKVKYGYRAGDETPANPDAWFEATEEQAGSWWVDWGKWLKQHAGGQVNARQPGRHKDYPVVEDAPGAYVQRSMDETR